MITELLLDYNVSVSGHHGVQSVVEKQADADSCYWIDGFGLQVSADDVHGLFRDKKGCNLDNSRMEGKNGCEQDSLQCSLCCSVTQANPLFSCKT